MYTDILYNTCNVNLAMISPIDLIIFILHPELTQAPALRRCQPRCPIFSCSLASVFVLAALLASSVASSPLPRYLRPAALTIARKCARPLSPSFFLRFLSCCPTFRVPPLKWYITSILMVYYIYINGISITV